MGVFSKDGAWWIDYYAQGRRKRERIGGPLTGSMKKVAQDVLAKRRVELAEGKFLDKRKVPKCTFDELASLYLDWAKVNHSGFASTRSRVGLMQAEFGMCQLSAITPLIVDTYAAKRAAVRKPATVNREIQILHHMFCKALEWGKALTNPIQHQRPLRTNNRRLRYLSLEEMEQLLVVADDVLRPILISAFIQGFDAANFFSSPGKISISGRGSSAWCTPRMGSAGSSP